MTNCYFIIKLSDKIIVMYSPISSLGTSLDSMDRIAITQEFTSKPPTGAVEELEIF